MVSSLTAFVKNYPRLLVLTGAGISAGSGIPVYRNDQGEWLPQAPIEHADFIREHPVRQRYWARSLAGWPRVQAAQPNAAHHALASLEQSGHIPWLVTQNVDGLHQRAGHQRVIDLHGNLATATCMACGTSEHRRALQHRLEQLNPEHSEFRGVPGPDGDSVLDASCHSNFKVPDCLSCGGILKPDVVFFGGSVPDQRVQRVRQALADADALLVVGSSLMVYSGFRFCRQAASSGKPIAIINRGVTRADDMASLKVNEDCASVLPGLARVWA